VILVTGATGNAGGAVVEALLRRKEAVRALTRGSESTALPPGVEPVVGDLDHPESLSRALQGVDGVFLLSGYRDMPGVLAEIRNAGAQRVVLLSSSAVPRGDMTNAIARYHIVSEDAVKDSGVAWTMLQPNSFMSNAYRWLPQLRAGDVVRVPFPTVRVATIDPRDLGEVAALALLSNDHAGRSYRLSGPESLLPGEQVRTLATVLGRDLRFEGLTDTQAREDMNANMPSEYADAFFRFFVDGDLDESQVLPTVEELTGRPPRTFEEWAITHADAFV
jgi:uncharacterized protein YbjT (DUF2867 family)